MTLSYFKISKHLSRWLFALLACFSLGLITPALAAATTNAAANSLATPEIPPSALLGWAQHAIATTFNYDYTNYKAAQKNAERYFTPEAWKQYSAAIEKSGNLKAIVERKMRVIAIPGDAKFLDQGVLKDRYNWKISLPLKLLFQNAENNSILQEQNSIVTLVISKTPTNVNPQGIGIGSLVMEAKKS